MGVGPHILWVPRWTGTPKMVLLFIIRGKPRSKENTDLWMVNLEVGLVVLRRKGDGDTGPGQTRKKPKDLSAREREERGCGSIPCIMYKLFICSRIKKDKTRGYKMSR